MINSSAIPGCRSRMYRGVGVGLQRKSGCLVVPNQRKCVGVLGGRRNTGGRREGGILATVASLRILSATLDSTGNSLTVIFNH